MITPSKLRRVCTPLLADAHAQAIQQAVETTQGNRAPDQSEDDREKQQERPDNPHPYRRQKIPGQSPR